MKVAFEHQVMDLLFNSIAEIITCIILQRTSTDNTKPKVAESENIGANHLEFAKSLFQHYCQYLELNHNHISTKSAFNFYVNEKISSLLGTPVNTESARETFYKELIQNTNLPTNHNFGKLQTPAVTPKKLQPPAWKKNRVESPSNPSYHYTPGSAINISSTDTFLSTATSTFGQFLFQSRQRKTELLGLYGLQSPPPPPDFRISDPWETPPQPSNLDPIAYAPITKLNNFTGKEDDTQVWLNDVEKAITVNRWNDARAMQAIPYFFKDTADSYINCLVNTFTTMKQEETEAVTTYLGRFHRNLGQIQAIDDDYFTAPQIFNQFICGLCSSILQHVCPLHPDTLQDTVTCARDFESAESEANHAQAVNLVMNGSSELNSKLEKFSESINKRLKEYLADNHAIYQPPQQRNNQGHPNCGQNQLCLSSSINQQWQQETYLPSRLHTQNLDTSRIQNPNFQHYLSLLITPENTTSNNTEFNQHVPTNTILPATISSNESLVVIFPFELEENTPIPLFSRAALEEKPITAMYTDARVDGHPIKLILDIDRTASARIITADGVTKTSIGEIDEFFFEVNGIVTPIKVLVMEATQYQALVGNDWLSKGQHIRVLATYGHFKTPPREKLLIELEEEKEKPTWEAYQILWADEEHNKLPSILSWDDNNKEKGKQKEKLT
ncbi:hypothetical protein G9A89_008826 [Geosiphon pyriformis]|nr:hypothetical protein G9A89_008826 [Geosiphon pyriformis]